MSTEASAPATDATHGREGRHLPDDPLLLKKMIAELLATLHAEQRENEQLRHRLDQLLRRLYGPRAERWDPNQPLLFGDAATPAAAEPTPVEAPPPAPPPAPAEQALSGNGVRTGHGRRVLPGNLPRRRVEHDLSEADKPCPACGQERQRIGEEISEQLDYQPASLFVVEHARFKYACKHCQEHVTIAAKPAAPIDKGLPGPGLLAQVITSKYADHLPLHRLERIFARHGLELSRSTSCGWMAACAGLLMPLYAFMVSRVLASKVIHTDDTPVPVQDKDRDSTRQGRMWVYLGDRHHPYTVFAYTPNRQRDGPAEFLRSFRGYLQADAFGGYDGIYAGSQGAIVEVACWAHARRKFYEARTSDPARSHAALAWIGKLYDVEDRGKELTPLERAAWRQAQSRPLLTALRHWFDEQYQAVLPKSPMGQAIAYALSNWEALVRYTDDGDLAIDNNAAERALRAIAVGRKNWLFAGSDQGGKTAAVLFSVTATCQRHNIDPFAYLRDVLGRIASQPRDRLEELLPDRWLTSPVSSA
jgi:transposase